jgi:hypothetical protein
MSRPNRVRILNLDFRVEWAEGSRARLMEHSGEIFFEEQVILINANRTPQWQADTLLHEIIHGLCRLMGFEDYAGHDDDEDFTGRISTGLCTVWMHNPDVMSWIHLSLLTPGQPHQTLAEIMAAGPPKVTPKPQQFTPTIYRDEGPTKGA